MAYRKVFRLSPPDLNHVKHSPYVSRPVDATSDNGDWCQAAPHALVAFFFVRAHALGRSVTLINAVEGRKRKTIHTQKYGCGVIRYTHHDQVGRAVMTKKKTAQLSGSVNAMFDLGLASTYNGLIVHTINSGSCSLQLNPEKFARLFTGQTQTRGSGRARSDRFEPGRIESSQVGSGRVGSGWVELARADPTYDISKTSCPDQTHEFLKTS